MNESKISFSASLPARVPAFSHIYLEDGARDYPLARTILAAHPQAEQIPIRHYKDVFNRSHQDFLGQKASPALILAENRGELVYRGARVCQSFGYDNFYYCSNLYNCIFDCEYCYLQGMYPSGNIVVFVNTEDYFARIRTLLSEGPVYLCISYDTDLLALEQELGLVRTWVDFALSHPGLTLEIRTKAALSPADLGLPVCDRVIYAWTLSPEEVAGVHEHHAPSPALRIGAAERTMAAGHPVRLCFDPMLRIPDYENAYRRLFAQTFERLEADRLYDVGIGVFRISASYLKSMRKKRTCAVTAYPYETLNGIATYDEKRSREMLSFARSCLQKYLSADRIFETDF